MKKIAEKHTELKTEAILTTEKDAVKLHNLEAKHGIAVYFNRIEIEADEGFYGRISAFMSASSNG